MLYPALFAAAILFVLMPLYLYSKDRWPIGVQLTLKAASTFLCLCVALGYCVGVGFQQTDAALILIGLFLCMLGDVFLEFVFPVGGGLFFLGHIGYVFAFLIRGRTPWSVLAFAVVAIAVSLVYRRYRQQIPGSLRLPVAGYGVILCVLGAAAIPLPFLAYSPRALFGALGAMLFIASDLTLCRNLLEKCGLKQQYISLGMYYMGQLMLALSAAM